MSTSQNTSLSKPKIGEVISRSSLAYMRTRLKHRVLNLIVKELRKSEVSQAEVARRLDMDKSQLSRLLSGPGNMSLDTISDLLFAINGLEMATTAEDPFVRRQALKAPTRNIDAPPVDSLNKTTGSSPYLLDAFRNAGRSNIANVAFEDRPNKAA